MPKFAIERQYLVPMYQHIVVEAGSLEEACEKPISEDINWDTQEMDSDSARRTTITNIKVILDALVADDIIVHRDRPARPEFEVAGDTCYRFTSASSVMHPTSPLPAEGRFRTTTEKAPRRMGTARVPRRSAPLARSRKGS